MVLGIWAFLLVIATTSQTSSKSRNGALLFVNAQDDSGDTEEGGDAGITQPGGDDGGENDTTTKDETKDDDSYMDVLGEPAWTRLRPGWSLTVNDQCLYEFVFQFVHDETLPLGESEFRDNCGFGEETDGETFTAPDGKLYLEPRQMWERFPDYVWATIGFNHLSVDWHPCGIFPTGYAEAQYAFSVRSLSSIRIEGCPLNQVFEINTHHHRACMIRVFQFSAFRFSISSILLLL